MVKLKVDHRDVTEEERGAAGSFSPPPPPGMWPYRVEEFNDGFSRDADTGKNDESKPRYEVVLSCAAEKFAGSKLWAYFLQPGHPSYNKKDKAKWDQFLVATGALSAKKRTGTIDTDKDIVGHLITVQVGEDRPDANGDKRARYLKAFPLAEGSDVVTSDEGMLSDDGDLIDGDGDELTEEVDWDARKAELLALDAAGIKAVAKEWKDAGWDITIGGTKAALADAIIAIEQAAAEQEDSTEEVEPDGDGDLADDEEIIDDDEVIEEESEGYTEEQLNELDNPGLVSVAKELNVFQKGMKRSAVIAAILEAQGGIGAEPF